MKITICSDLHLELGEISLIDAPEADLLVLAGDILKANELTYLDNLSGSTITGLERARRYFNFITKCCRLYKHVIFVIGNHEHYEGEFYSTANIIKDTFSHIENFHLLNNDSLEINGIMFLGCSLWTNMNDEDPQTIDAIYEGLNDYRRIMFDDGIGIRDFEPEDSIEEYQKSIMFLTNKVQEYATKKLIVVTHHAPSKLSTHPRMDSNDLLNCAYYSDLENFIENHPQIKYWIHGHTHKRHNYMIGNTNIVCNPRGYLGAEPTAMQFEWLMIEI